MSDTSVQYNRSRKLGRRDLLRGSAVAAGLGSVTLASAFSAGPAGAVASTTIGDRQFVTAQDFIGDAGAPAWRSGWPAIEHRDGADTTSTASFTLPANTGAVAIDLVWTSVASGSGNVRWAGGIYWPELDLAIDDGGNGTPWQLAVPAAPSAPKRPVVTRLGEYAIDTSATCLRLQLTRQGADSADTFNYPVLLLGALVTVTAIAPLA